MVKILITTIQVNLSVGAAPFFTAWLFLIRFSIVSRVHNIMGGDYELLIVSMKQKLLCRILYYLHKITVLINVNKVIVELGHTAQPLLLKLVLGCVPR